MENDFDRDFDTYLERVTCFNVITFKYEDRCHFLHKVPDCETSDNPIITMVDILECKLKTRSRFAEWILVLIMIVFAFYCVLMIAIVADTFFCPALKIIAKLLHMSEHLAGATILAFGNSADEFFSHISNIGHGEQIITNCVSKSVFITMVAGGAICFFRPFKMNGYETVRDMMFFLAGLYYVENVSKDSLVSLFESFCIIGIYLIFVFVSTVDICLESRELKKQNELMKRKKSISKRRRSSVIEHVHRPSSISTIREAAESAFTTRRSTAAEFVDIEATKTALYGADHPKNYNLFRDFINSVNPFYGRNWSESSVIMKFYIIIKAPVCLVTQIYIPIVDVEAEKHGWSKLLNCIQIILLAPIGLVLTENEEQIEFMLYSLLLTTPIAIFVMWHTRTDLPPYYHNVFALLNCIGSLCFIFLASGLIEDVLTIIGSFVGFSKDFCGATIWGWGFAIGDTIANIVLAFQGYENMAFAACVGGPFFTLMICTGLVFVAESWSSGKSEIENGVYSENAFVFLVLALVTTLLWASLLNFNARRCVGVYSFMLYALFILFSILTEKEVIHTFKDDDTVKVL